MGAEPLTGAGNLTVNGVFTWTGGELAGVGARSSSVRTRAASLIATDAGKVLGRHLRNDGYIEWSGGNLSFQLRRGRDSHLDNHGTFEITGIGKSAVWSAGATAPDHQPARRHDQLGCE